jgi:hypothetical protein
MTHQICIFASEFASIARYNSYVNDEEALEKLMKSNSWLRKEYEKNNEKVEVYKDDIHRTLDKLPTEERKDLCATLNTTEEDLHKVVKKVVEESKSLSSTTEKESIDELSKTIKDMKLDVLSSAMHKTATMERGKKNEDKALNNYEKTSNSTVKERNTKGHKKVLFSFSCGKKNRTYDILIYGKVDGIDENGQIIETKNRRKRLFNSIPIYEQVQLELYMWLLDVKSAIHIENYNDQQVKTAYSKNEELFKNMIVKCEEFVKKVIERL